MGNGILTEQGRIYLAELLRNSAGSGSPSSVQSPIWAAVGDGDLTFSDPLLPPAENADQAGLIHEVIRKQLTTKEFVVEDVAGAIIYGSRKFTVSVPATKKVLFVYDFDFNEANFTWKEYGFFGGGIAYGLRYDGSQPPIASGIAGVTIDFVDPLNGTGAGALTFTLIGTTLKWKAPGGATFGTPVNIGGGGNFQLSDGDTVAKKIRVSVSAVALPVADAAVTPTLAAASTIAGSGLNSPTNPQGQIASNGRLIFVRNIPSNVKNSGMQRPLRWLVEF